ncbi:hypothetical protein GPJ56_000559 [Histomonas meleagridis]|uniref:uncharacterized protein n=1 Tax=Histomonas meleagridis TaxID=135588 RepID=UPI00355ACCE4|nr:hypothetical protein GPJ56_000559 [Histomonas meleagridis]KAH0796401.1 hypothetical protein GO595_010294 [Histomonas meleagridis]
MPFGAPKQMVVLSDFIILLFADGNKVPQIEKISSSGTVQKFPLQIFNIDINIDNLNFSVFDNAILVTDTKKNRSALLDFQDTEKYKVVGDVFDIKKGFKCIFDDTFSLFDNEIYEIKTNYEAIAQMKISKHLIAYLFRRRNGITSAVNMLIRRLKETCTSYQMKKLVKKIAPSLTSPVTQIRFVRALQFCGILNPQLLMIGMIEFYSIIGSEMTCEVKEAVFDIFTHNSCRNALIDLFNCRPSLIKLDEEALRLLMRKCGTDMIIQPRNVDNLYEYAKVCIEFGMQKEAKKLILRVILDQNEISPDKNMLDEIEDLKEKYQKRFQSDITYWSKTTS